MKLIITFFLLLIATTFCSCQKELAPKNIMVPVDLSDSRDSGVIAWYKNTITESILKNLGTKDKITILPVDQGSELWGQEIYSYDFGKNLYTNEYAGLESDKVEQRNLSDTVRKSISAFEQAFDKAVAERKRLNKMTDILGSLRQIKKYFLDGYENIVVIFSDMQQSSNEKELNLERKGITTADTENFIKKSAPVDLKQISIIVLTGQQTSIQPEKFSAIQDCWTRYFENCGAHLIDYSTGTPKILEHTLLKQSK